jgi:hypothetical protein
MSPPTNNWYLSQMILEYTVNQMSETGCLEILICFQSDGVNPARVIFTSILTLVF